MLSVAAQWNIQACAPVCWCLTLTVHAPLDGPAVRAQQLIHSLQNCLQLLFLADLRLRHLGHVQLSAWQLFCWGHQRHYGLHPWRRDSAGILRGQWSSMLGGKLMLQLPHSHQITSGAPVRRNNPPPGLWLWSALPPVHCWSSRSGPGDTHSNGSCWSCSLLFWFNVWLCFTFRRSLNLRFSRDVGSNMTRSAFSSETTGQSVSAWVVVREFGSNFD